MKGSNYLSVIKGNPRYRIRYNHLYAILNQSIFKSEQMRQQEEIEQIIEQELTEDFALGAQLS